MLHVILISYRKVDKKSVQKLAYMGFVRIFCLYFDEKLVLYISEYTKPFKEKSSDRRSSWRSVFLFTSGYIDLKSR